MISKESKSQIIHYCQRMDQKGWVANHDGNITIMTSDGRLAATPTSRSKADLLENDLLELDRQGKKVGGGAGSPFSEIGLHLKIYQARPDVRAVVHAHPPTSTAVGCAHQEMVTLAVPEAVVSLGPGVPLVALGLPGSNRVNEEFAHLIPHYDAVMIAGNGVFAWGSTLEQAFLRLELVEHLAQILLASMPLGGPKLLSSEEVKILLKKRKDAGLSLPPDAARPNWFLA